MDYINVSIENTPVNIAYTFCYYCEFFHLNGHYPNKRIMTVFFMLSQVVIFYFF